MTISTTIARNSYTGAGSVGPYVYGFKIYAASDLQVITRSSVGAETTLVYLTDYTVAGTGNDTGGSVTLTTALPVGSTLTIKRAMPITQPASLRNQGTYFPETIEDQLDRAIAIAQQQQEQLDRTIHLSPGLTGSLVLPELTAGKAIVGTGTGLTMATLDTTASVALPGASRTVASLSAYLLNNAVFNVLDYGADPTNTTSSSAAITLAVAGAVAAGGGTVLFPAGAYKIGTTIAVPSYVTIRGGGIGWTTLKRSANVAIFSFAAANNQVIEDMTLDGNATAAALVTFTDANATYAKMKRVFVTNYPAGNSAMTFAADAAPFSRFENVTFEPTGASSTVAAIQFGVDTGPKYRRFDGCDALNGNPLVDVAGSEMTWFVDCAMGYALFSLSTARKALFLACRIASATLTTTVKGVNHAFCGCLIAGPVTFDNTTTNCSYAANVEVGAVTDNGTNNVIATRSMTGGAIAVTYSASMTLDAATGDRAIITATNSTAFTINAPTNPTAPGQRLRVRIRNTSGGALGVATWNAVFKMTAWTQPANGFSRSIDFDYDGTNWVESSRSAADVAN